MAFTGVNRANVAVTDTFDTWRIRTNEMNNTLNLAAAANTADTLVYRDNAGSANLNVLNANSTVVTHTSAGSDTTALSVVSGVGAHSGGSYASILTTGGIYATLTSKFAADLTIGTNLTVDGNIVAGSNATKTLTFNATLTGDILPTTTTAVSSGAAEGSDLGATANSFAHIYTSQETIDAVSTITKNVFSVTSAAGAGNTAVFLNNAITTGGVLQVLSSSTDASERELVHINQSGDAGASSALSALKISTTAGKGLYIDSDDADGKQAIDVDAEQTTTNTISIDAATTTGTSLDVIASGVLVGAGKAVEIRSDTVTTGTLLSVNSAATNTSTRSLVKITNDAPAAVGVTAFEIDSDAGRGIYVNSGLAASLPSLEITSALATTNTAIITADSTTDGTVFQLSADALEDGRALDISSTSTDTSARRLVSITNDAAAATGTDALYIQSDAGKGIYVTSTLAAGGPALDILSAHQTTDAINVVANALTTGGVLDISSSSTATNGRALATITQSGDVTTSGDTTGLKLAMTSGRGIFIDSNDADGEEAFEIDSETATTNTMALHAATTTATGAYFNFPALTTGTGLNISSGSAGLSTASALVELNQSHALSSAANVATLSVATAGNGAYGVKINSTHATSNASLRIDSTTTTKNIIEVVGNALTSGDGMQINTSAAHSGQLISLTSTATADSARGEALHIQYNTANTTAKAITVANSSANMFTVEQSGDVAVGRDLSIGGNLSVQGTTTQINTTTTIARDSSIVLGAQSAIVTGASYTAASPAVVTSSAHGLADTNVIFVVASSGTASGDVAIPSERLFKVANKTTNTFELETIDGNCELESATVTGDATGYLVLNGTDGTAANAGDNISMSEGVDATGDSNRIFSWVGPQTDAATDDAGIIVPGGTASHYVKWDNTDNYWKLNDSLMVESSGQFVFPKGTTADKPAASATSTLAAAVQGAMRFNTSNDKFEGVSTGTSYENISTEGFAVAVSIALG